uniref:Beta-secretase 2-like n=1 Tax=Sinocyclocheilus anshuiensis TaxID=1608454 RepID=A0A671KQ94_9TELE
MWLYGLLLLSLSFWTSHSVFKIPLKMFAGKFNASVQLDLRPLRKIESAAESGLSLASDPAGIVNFLDMINNLKGDSGRGYYIQMVIGTPGQTLNILVDTGSSNFAVAAAAHPFIIHYYNRALSSTYKSSGRGVAVKYAQGEWEGELGSDWITIPQGPSGTITINIAAIISSEGFFLPGINWQGILGLAYPLLARPDPSVEPFFNSVVRQTSIPDVFSLQMCGAGVSASTTADPTGGSLIMGGVEPTLYRGSVWYTPVLEEWYYQVEVLKIEVGAQNLNLDCKKRLSLQNDSSVTIDCIEDFSAGFFDGTKLACWMRGESPWRLFPKISIYLRAMNTSQSFRLTILPQVRTFPSTLHFVHKCLPYSALDSEFRHQNSMCVLYMHHLIFVAVLCTHRSHMRIELILPYSVVPQGGNIGPGRCFTEENQTKELEQQQNTGDFNNNRHPH